MSERGGGGVLSASPTLKFLIQIILDQISFEGSKITLNVSLSDMQCGCFTLFSTKVIVFNTLIYNCFITSFYSDCCLIERPPEAH